MVAAAVDGRATSYAPLEEVRREELPPPRGAEPTAPRRAATAARVAAGASLLCSALLAAALLSWRASPGLEGGAPPQRGGGIRRAHTSRCQLCHLEKDEAPRLYIPEVGGGAGQRVLELVCAMAVAARNGMNLGGVVRDAKVANTSHATIIYPIEAAVLGLHSPAELFVDKPPSYDLMFKDLKALEAHLAKSALPNRSNIFFNNSWFLSLQLNHVDNYEEYWSKRFLSVLQRPDTEFASRKIKVDWTRRPYVVIHLRRGDVKVNNTKRATPDEWYYSLMELLVAKFPQAQFHVFSSTEWGNHKSHEFDGYRQRGAEVHLNGDIVDDWAHFAKADILVMAKSSFSAVPALFNPNCVLYQPYWQAPLARWARVESNESTGLPALSDEAWANCTSHLSNDVYNESSSATSTTGATSTVELGVAAGMGAIAELIYDAASRSS